MYVCVCSCVRIDICNVYMYIEREGERHMEVCRPLNISTLKSAHYQYMFV